MERKKAYKRIAVILILSIPGVVAFSFLKNFTPHSLEWNAIWLVGAGLLLSAMWLCVLTISEVLEGLKND